MERKDGAEAGIEPFSLSLKIKENFKFENFSTSMSTPTVHTAFVQSVVSAVRCFKRKLLSVNDLFQQDAQ